MSELISDNLINFKLYKKVKGEPSTSTSYKDKPLLSKVSLSLAKDKPLEGLGFAFNCLLRDIRDEDIDVNNLIVVTDTGHNDEKTTQKRLFFKVYNKVKGIGTQCPNYENESPLAEVSIVYSYLKKERFDVLAAGITKLLQEVQSKKIDMNNSVVKVGVE